MAYVPKDWVTGEVITESALDHIEQGIASVVLPVTEEANVLSKTWQEIHDAFASGSLVTIYLNDPIMGERMSFVKKMSSEEGSYSLEDNASNLYTTSSADGYPTASVG